VRVTVKLYASLSDYLPKDARDWRLDLDVGGGASLAQVIEMLHLPPARVHLALLNGVYIGPECRSSTAVADGDVVALWPPVAGG